MKLELVRTDGGTHPAITVDGTRVVEAPGPVEMVLHVGLMAALRYEHVTPLDDGFTGLTGISTRG